jgi:hypothetical protein
MMRLEAAIHQRQERKKLLQATGDRKLFPAVTALSKDFFELAQLEREDWEILDDLSDLYRTLADDQPTDLLDALDEAVKHVIVGDAVDIEFTDSRERQKYLALIKTRKPKNETEGEAEGKTKSKR